MKAMMKIENQSIADDLVGALMVLLDCVDYKAGNCKVNDMVGAALPEAVIRNARAAIKRQTDQWQKEALK